MKPVYSTLCGLFSNTFGVKNCNYIGKGLIHIYIESLSVEVELDEDS